jgi:hypothetical protein
VMLSGYVLTSTAITTAGPRRAGAILKKYPFYAQLHRPDTYVPPNPSTSPKKQK